MSSAASTDSLVLLADLFKSPDVSSGADREGSRLTSTYRGDRAFFMRHSSGLMRNKRQRDTSRIFMSLEFNLDFVSTLLVDVNASSALLEQSRNPSSSTYYYVKNRLSR